MLKDLAITPASKLTKFSTGDHPLLSKPFLDVVDISSLGEYNLDMLNVYRDSMDPFPNDGHLAAMRSRFSTYLNQRSIEQEYVATERISFTHLGQIYRGIVIISTYERTDISDHDICIVAKSGDTVVTYNDNLFNGVPVAFTYRHTTAFNDPMSYPLRYTARCLPVKNIIKYLYQNRSQLNIDIIETYFILGPASVKRMHNYNWLIPFKDIPRYQPLIQHMTNVLLADSAGLNIMLSEFLSLYTSDMSHPQINAFIRCLSADNDLRIALDGEGNYAAEVHFLLLGMGNSAEGEM